LRNNEILTGTGIKTYGDEFSLGGVQLGNVWIGVQPPLGYPATLRLMFERDLTPIPNMLPLSMVAAWLSS